MSEDFKVKDISLADFGRKEISIAETSVVPVMDILYTEVLMVVLLGLNTPFRPLNRVLPILGMARRHRLQSMMTTMSTRCGWDWITCHIMPIPEMRVTPGHRR